MAWINRKEEMLPGSIMNRYPHEIRVLGKTGSHRILGADYHYADKAGG